VTPNRVTAASIALKTGSGVLLLQHHFGFAALTFAVGVLLDGVDGKLARLSGTGSEFGGLLDYSADYALFALLVVFLGAAFSLPIGLVGACAALGVGSALVTRNEVKSSELKAPASSWTARRGLVSAPGVLEAHVLLFAVAPLTGRSGMLVAMTLATTYFGLAWLEKLRRLHA
jgi:phosphatidylglycerophosphate synthase